MYEVGTQVTVKAVASQWHGRKGTVVDGYPDGKDDLFYEVNVAGIGIVLYHHTEISA
jgi:hypothetical protein